MNERYIMREASAEDRYAIVEVEATGKLRVLDTHKARCIGLARDENEPYEVSEIEPALFVANALNRRYHRTTYQNYEG